MNPKFELQYCLQTIQRSKLSLIHFLKKNPQGQQLQQDMFAYQYRLGKPDERTVHTFHDLNVK